MDPADSAPPTLTNPVIGNMGSDPSLARSGALFFGFAMYLWRMAMYVGAIVVIAYYVIAALEWISSGSDSKGVEKAKSRFVNATIGLILLVCSFAIVSFINEIIFQGEFNLLEFTIPG